MAAASVVGGPMMGALGVAAAAIGYGIYSMSSSKEEEFEDALEEDSFGGSVVQIAVNGGKQVADGESGKKSSVGFL